MYGVLSNIQKGSGYIGANTTYFNANKDKITIKTAEEMLFSDGVETTLKVKLVTDTTYPG